MDMRRGNVGLYAHVHGIPGPASPAQRHVQQAVAVAWFDWFVIFQRGANGHGVEPTCGGAFPDKGRSVWGRRNIQEDGIH